MNDGIKAGGVPVEESSAGKKFIPMQVGKAVVYVEKQGDVTTEEDGIYTVAPSPKQAFETAIEVLKECVRVVGERMEELAGKAMPKELEVEFSITFDAKAKGTLIPVFVTSEHGLQTGLKVKAVWKGADGGTGSGVSR